MTHKLKGLVLFAALVALAGPSFAWFDSTQDRTNHVVYSTAPLAATIATTTILVDLSDTTNWPHKNNREINISAIRVDVDKVAASTGTVRVGVVNTINPSTGSVTWFFEKSFLYNVSNADNDVRVNYAPNFIKTRVEGGGNIDAEGTTPYLLSSDKTTASTSFQTDVTMPTLRGTLVAPGRGDIVVEILKSGASAWVVNVELDYHTPETK